MTMGKRKHYNAAEELGLSDRRDGGLVWFSSEHLPLFDDERVDVLEAMRSVGAMVALPSTRDIPKERGTRVIVWPIEDMGFVDAYVSFGLQQLINDALGHVLDSEGRLPPTEKADRDAILVLKKELLSVVQRIDAALAAGKPARAR